MGIPKFYFIPLKEVNDVVRFSNAVLYKLLPCVVSFNDEFVLADDGEASEDGVAVSKLVLDIELILEAWMI